MKDAYAEFLKNAEEFIFAENTPEKSDIIFVPGNGYPQMAECAAQLFREGMAEWILPSGKYSVVNGEFSGVLEKSDIYNKEYETEWEFLKEVLIKNGVPEEKILREDQATFTYENAIYSRQITDQMGLEIKKGNFVLQIVSFQKMPDVLSDFIPGNTILCSTCGCRWNRQRELAGE